MKSAGDYLDLARKHLERVQGAWDQPTDWADLAIYGLYSLEAAVLAAAVHEKLAIKKTHWHKRDLAEAFPGGLDAEDVATAVEDYVDAVAALIERERA